MTVHTSAGSKLYIGTRALVPATDEDYLLVGEIVNLGEFGRVYEVIRHNSLDQRGTRKFKGTFDDGALAMQLGQDSDDVGQIRLLEARDSDYAYNFKIELNDALDQTGATPTTFTFKGKVFSKTVNVGGPNQIVASNCNIEIDSGTITETEASD
jgi:hypothetical protein